MSHSLKLVLTTLFAPLICLAPAVEVGAPLLVRPYVQSRLYSPPLITSGHLPIISDRFPSTFGGQAFVSSLQAFVLVQRSLEGRLGYSIADATSTRGPWIQRCLLYYSPSRTKALVLGICAVVW